MPRDWESQFKEWGKPPGRTENDRCENALSSIRNAINASDKLKLQNITVCCQGSYRNNTNVRKDSDVDVGVLCKNTIFYDLQSGQNAVSLGLTPATYFYSQFKNDVGDALTSYFGKDAVTRGNKAFELHETSYHIDADVAPFFEYRRYLSYGGYHEGVALLTDNEQNRVENWPEQHYKNGVRKNEDTKRKYKKIVRVLKALSNEMTQANIPAGNVSSFLIECLVWNVPNHLFQLPTYPAYNTGQAAASANVLATLLRDPLSGLLNQGVPQRNSLRELRSLVATPPRTLLSDLVRQEATPQRSFVEDVKAVLLYLRQKTTTIELCQDWREVSKLKGLFQPGQKWTRLQANNFVTAAWNYTNLGN